MLELGFELRRSFGRLGASLSDLLCLIDILFDEILRNSRIETKSGSCAVLLHKQSS